MPPPGGGYPKRGLIPSPVEKQVLLALRHLLVDRPRHGDFGRPCMRKFFEVASPDAPALGVEAQPPNPIERLQLARSSLERVEHARQPRKRAPNSVRLQSAGASSVL